MNCKEFRALSNPDGTGRFEPDWCCAKYATQAHYSDAPPGTAAASEPAAGAPAKKA